MVSKIKVKPEVSFCNIVFHCNNNYTLFINLIKRNRKRLSSAVGIRLSSHKPITYLPNLPKSYLLIL